MLEIILNVDISRIEYVEEQKTIDIKKDSRGIRLDIYVCDEEETVFNVDYSDIGITWKYNTGKKYESRLCAHRR